MIALSEINKFGGRDQVNAQVNAQVRKQVSDQVSDHLWNYFK
jgi:hypothetical protein